MVLTSHHLKVALLSYYRFQRQCVCVDEFNGADVIVDTGQDIIEIEVKISKNDLCAGERKKQRKHQCYLYGHVFHQCHPNRFMFCVPTSLREAAESMIDELNPKYGLILFDESRWVDYLDLGATISIVKRAGQLHDRYSSLQQRLIAKRASSKLITLMQKQLIR